MFFCLQEQSALHSGESGTGTPGLLPKNQEAPASDASLGSPGLRHGKIWRDTTNLHAKVKAGLSQNRKHWPSTETFVAARPIVFLNADGATGVNETGNGS